MDNSELGNIAIRRTALTTALESLDLEKVGENAQLIAHALEHGHKVLVCGNGGSAAQAQHFAAELTCTYRDIARASWPAIALHTDTSALTAWSNDMSYDWAFERMVEAHGKKGDVLVALTTSGRSKNIIYACKSALARGMKVVILTGPFLEKTLKRRMNLENVICVGSRETPRVQEVHQFILHEFCEALEPTRS